MILDLVERRTNIDAVGAEFQGANWQRLTRLAAGLGVAAWPVDVVLLDDESMVELNRRFRDQDQVTDVLSFSYLEFTGNQPPDLPRGEGQAPADIWLATGFATAGAGETVGELVLAPAFIAARCAANAWPLATEISLLIVHGCLHLLGWDHETPAARQAMQEREEIMLAEEGLTHPLRQRS